MPSMLLEIFATESVATAPPMLDAAEFVSANLTGTVLPSLKMLDPSELIGWKTPLNMYCTSVVQDFVFECPMLSVTVRLTVLGPTVAVLIATDPLGSETRPEWASDAVTVALTPEAFSSTAAGHVTLRLGAVASTLVSSDASADSLPT